MRRQLCIHIFVFLLLLSQAACDLQAEGEATIVPPTEVSLDPTTPPATQIPPIESSEVPSEDRTLLFVDPAPYLQGDPIPLFQANLPVTLTYVDAQDWAIAMDESGTDHILTRVGHSSTHRRWYDWTPPEPAALDADVAKRATLFALDPHNVWVAYLGKAQHEVIIWRYTGERLRREWEPSVILTPSMIGDVSFYFLDEDHGWMMVIFDEGGMSKEYFSLYRTQDGGRTWEELINPEGGSGLQPCPKTGMVFKNSETGWITRSCRGLYPDMFVDATYDGGRTWSQVELPAPEDDPQLFSEAFCGVFRPVFFPPFDLIVQVDCVTEFDPEEEHKNYLYLSSDEGATWSAMKYPGGFVEFGDRFTAYAISREIYRSVNGGLDWELTKAVNWDGQFAFRTGTHAYVIARNEDEIAYLETQDGLNTFVMWENEIHPLQDSYDD